METRDICEEYLGDTLTKDIENPHVKDLVEIGQAMNPSLPKSMLRMMAIYEMSNFVSQFQWKIKLGTTLIPVNVIGLVIAKSGAGKDSSRKEMEKSLAIGYASIERERKEIYIAKAKIAARDAGVENPDQYYHKFMKRIAPIKNAISTAEGITSRLNQFQRDGIGMPTIFSGELGSELQTNSYIIDNIRLLSELFDLGDKASKAIKDADRQDAEVKGMGMSAMFMGSPQNLIMDEAVLRKLQTEFVTKLARRSYLIYPLDDEYTTLDFESVDDIFEAEIEREAKAALLVDHLSDIALEAANVAIDTQIRHILIDDETMKDYRIYRKWCETFANDKFKYESHKLHRVHSHWRALKVAGVFAAFDASEYITKLHLKQAISFTEQYIDHIYRFEVESNLQSYEKMLFALEDGDKMSYHDLRKAEYISSKNSKPETAVDALVSMANSSLGSKGIVRHEDGMVWLEELKEIAQTHGASYLVTPHNKEERQYVTASGYQYRKDSFANLSRLMTNDVAYSPFRFRDGIRGSDYVEGSATFIVLDIDDSDESYNEIHDILDGIEHHVCMTSDETNPYKFRIILASDVEIDISAREWKALIEKVSSYIGVKSDILPKSQIFYGFSGRTALSCIDGEKLPISDMLKTIDVRVEPVKALTSNEKSKVVKDSFNVFNYAYEAPEGQGSIAMFRAFKHAVDLGFTEDETTELLNDINSYWEYPMPEDRFEKTIITQIKRHFNEAV